MDGSADSAQSRFKAAGRHRGIGIDSHQALVGSGVAYLRDVLHRVAQRDDFERRARRLDARKRLKFLRLERVLDRPQPVWPLGMAVRGEVIEAGRMGDQERGHRTTLTPRILLS